MVTSPAVITKRQAEYRAPYQAPEAAGRRPPLRYATVRKASAPPEPPAHLLLARSMSVGIRFVATALVRLGVLSDTNAIASTVLLSAR
jgi:hypothetical protein